MNRRRFLRNASALTAAASSLPAFLDRAHAEGKRRPNVILIFSDDQGSVDVNCYGATDLYTPHMDALAARGTRFTQFYVGAPVCSPSRAALLTGRTPERAGLTSNAGRNKGLPPEQVTIAEMLKETGYRTALFGKWHLGEAPEFSPLKQGFDEFFGHRDGCIDNYSHFFYWHGPNRHDLWRGDEEVWEDGKYFPDLIVREATRFLDEHKEEPFFLYLPFNIPHYPLQGEGEYREWYADQDTPYPRDLYAALVSTLDEKLGQIVAKVDELGLREDTLVIFLSDHGHSTEERTHFGGGSAGPYRGSKFTLWEGGIRVPCIASMPGVIPEGEVRDQFAASCDWFPTIAEVCGAKLPERTLDGKSLVAVLKSAEAPPTHTQFHWQLGNQWAVRDGDWKLVVNGRSSKRGEKIPDEDKVFLSNLAEDVTETKNVARANPEVVSRLRAMHQKWSASAEDQ